jgi:hypothetical protein
MIDIEELKPHEEVIEEIVHSLAREMQTQGIVRDPLIVDKDDYVILDGMHRFDSLKRLKCRFVPCCLLDYNSPQIKVGSWFRLFTVDDARAIAENLLSETRVDYSKRQVDAATMNYDAETAILTKDGTIFSLPSSLDPLERCRKAVSIEKRMSNGGHGVTYLSDTLAMQQLKSGQANFVIALPVFKKEEIREFGLERRLLPHKVTRHIIPSRPLAIDVPLTLLMDPMISCQEADDKFGELLSIRRVDRMAPGSVVEGRHYDEELLVFSR